MTGALKLNNFERSLTQQWACKYLKHHRDSKQNGEGKGRSCSGEKIYILNSKHSPTPDRVELFFKGVYLKFNETESKLKFYGNLVDLWDQLKELKGLRDPRSANSMLRLVWIFNELFKSFDLKIRYNNQLQDFVVNNDFNYTFAGITCANAMHFMISFLSGT